MPRNDPDDRTLRDFCHDVTAILNLRGLNRHTRRASLYKAIEDYSLGVPKRSYDHPGFRRSILAAALIRSRPGEKLNALLRREHIVPISVAAERLLGVSGTIEEDVVRLVFEKISTVCIILREEERNPGFLKDRMPSGNLWTFETGDVWERYRDIIQVEGGYSTCAIAGSGA